MENSYDNFIGSVSLGRWYRVAPDGRIKKHGTCGKFLSIFKDAKGYSKINYRLDRNRQSSAYVHRLVAEVYCPNPMEFKRVRFLDGNKDNLHYTNLEWF